MPYKVPTVYSNSEICSCHNKFTLYDYIKLYTILWSNIVCLIYFNFKNIKTII